jgi:hypothetical protein
MKHKFNYKLENLNNISYLNFLIEGKLTHNDYEIFVPSFEKFLLSIK